MAALVDTNILVYRFDPRFPEKQALATELLRAGIADDSLRVPHQALIEFIAATTKPLTYNRADHDNLCLSRPAFASVPMKS